MKIMMAFLLMSLLICGCGRHQAGSQSRIVGTWEKSDGRFGGRITFYPDGHLLSNWHYNLSHSNIYNGTWQITGDILIETVTNASGTEPHEYVGSVDQYKISRLDDSELVVSDLLRTNVPLTFTREK